MGFFQTEVKPVDISGMSKLIPTASQSPLKALSDGMSKLDSFLDKRAKTNYTEGAMAKMKGASSLEEMLALDIDRTQMSDAGGKAFDSRLNLMNLSDQAKQRDFTRGLQEKQEARSATIFDNQQDEILKDQITREVWANWDSMTPEHRQQAKEYSGADVSVLDKLIQDRELFNLNKKKTNLDMLKTAKEIQQIGKATSEAERSWGMLTDERKAEIKEKYGITTPLGFKKLVENQFKTQNITTKAGIVNRVAELEAKRNSGVKLDIKEQAELDTYKPYIESEGDENRKLIDTKATILTKYTKDDVDYSKIDIEDVNKLKAIEDKTNFKAGEAFKKDIRDREQTIEAGELLLGKLDKIGNEKVNRGIVDGIKQTAIQLVSDDGFERMSKEQKEKALLTIGINTAVGSALATYIKSISGTAVAEAEYNRLMKVFSTGNYSNIQSLKKAIGTFYDDAKHNHQAYLKNNIASGGSFALRKLRNHLNKYGKVSSGNQSFSFKVGDKSPNGVVIDSDAQYYKTEDGKVHKY